MERIEGESCWLFRPDLADVHVTREGLEAFGEVVGGNEVGEMAAKLIVGLVVESFDRGLFDRSVRSTWPLVQGCLGLVRRWSMSAWAQVYTKA